MSFVDEFLEGGKALPPQAEEEEKELEGVSSLVEQPSQRIVYQNYKAKANNYFEDSSSEEESEEEPSSPKEATAQEKPYQFRHQKEPEEKAKEKESSDEEEEEEKSQKKQNNFSFSSSESEEKLSPQEKAFNQFLNEGGLKGAEPKKEKEEEEEGEGEEIDFYQLSDIDNSQLAESSSKKPQKEDILKSSITKVLDSQANFASSVGSLCSDKQSILEKEEEYKKKGCSEITFGDLSSDGELIKVARNSESMGSSRVKPPLHQSVITEEEGEHDFSYSLNYSQVSGNQSMQRNSRQARNDLDRHRASALIIRMALSRQEAVKKNLAFETWKQLKVKNFYQVKLKNAAQMVDKMSRFSRSFISLNSLSAMLDKNKQRKLAKAMFRWARAGQSSQPSPSQPKQEEEDLREQLKQKCREVEKMEKMFQEYSSWTGKLEEIEDKMKKEAGYWKDSCEKLQRENESLQKEALKVTQQLLEKTKTIEAKEESIESLQKQLKQAKASFEPVEEVLCKQCQSSLEESQVFSKESFREVEQMRQLGEKLESLEKEVLTYRERVSYHESMEDELKKNIEQQVDVVLRMEEERLIMMKENKEVKEHNKKLRTEAEEQRERVEVVEKELGELQELVKQQDVLSESDTGAKNKENKSVNKRKMTKPKPVVKKPKTLQFVKQNESQMSCLSSTDESKASFQKTLSSDNQVLTSELVSMNREIGKLKAELRGAQEGLKKSEKEKYDCKKNLEGKDTAVEKLRKERDELWAIVNTDKYKNIKAIEGEKERAEKIKSDVEKELLQVRSLLQEQSQQKNNENERIKELEIEMQRASEKESSTQKLLKIMEEKNAKIEMEWEKSDSSVGTLRREVESLRQENGKTKKDLEWVANSAKNNKLQADRAIADLEAYTKILRGMEKKLAMVEIEKESKEQELKDLKARFVQVMQGLQATKTQPQPANYGPPNWQNVQLQAQGQQPRVQNMVPQPQQPPLRFDQGHYK